MRTIFLLSTTMFLLGGTLTVVLAQQATRGAVLGSNSLEVIMVWLQCPQVAYPCHYNLSMLP